MSVFPRAFRLVSLTVILVPGVLPNTVAAQAKVLSTYRWPGAPLRDSICTAIVTGALLSRK